MHRFHRILVPIEDKELSQPAISRAARLARQEGASIKLIAIVENLPWYSRMVMPNADELQTIMVREKLETLETLASQLRQEGLDVTTAVLQGREYLEVLKTVVEGKHDLLIKQAEANEQVQFGSTDMHLLRDCPIPLLLLKPGDSGEGFRQVLAAVDPAPAPDDADLLNLKAEVAPKDTALDTKILELAGLFADEEDAELHVVHAWSAPGEALARAGTMLAQEQVDRYVQDLQAEARKALDQLVARFPVPSEGRSLQLLKGNPADIVAEFVKARHIDLIVMGTVARTGLPGLVIGNTAESILQRVSCSVLAVKPDGFVSPYGK